MKKVVVELSRTDLQEMSGVLHEVLSNEAREMLSFIRKSLEQQQTGAAIAINMLLDAAMAKPVKSEEVKKAPRFVWRTVMSLIATDKKKCTNCFDWLRVVTAFDDESIRITAISPEGGVIEKEFPPRVMKTAAPTEIN